MEKEFIVLYTGQKQKKAKTWHDGTLKHDGRGTKAMLYDEKGGKLDSIHIKAQDIMLGEQLESDRYYILVETEKAVSKVSEAATQNNTNKIGTQEKPLSQKGVYSQARCAGLKRKTTGFMPPRIIKQARHDEQEVLDRSPLRLKNRIYPQQNDGLSSLQQTSNIESPYRQNYSQENDFHKRSPVAGRNVINLFSRDNIYGKDLGFSSPASISSPTVERSSSVSPVISPWSVYGSKSKLSQSPKLSGSTSDKAENIKNDTPSGDEMFNKISTYQSERNEKRNKLNALSDNVSKDRTSVPKVDNKACTNRPTSNSMQRIMNLLKINKEKRFNDNKSQSCDISNEMCAIESKEKNLYTSDLGLFSDQNCNKMMEDSNNKYLKSLTSDSNFGQICDQEFDSETKGSLSSFHIDSQESKLLSKLGESCDKNGEIGERTRNKPDSLQKACNPVDQDMQFGNYTNFQDNGALGRNKTENHLDTNKCCNKTNSICVKTHNGSNDELDTECIDQRSTNPDTVKEEGDSEGWFGLTFSPLSHTSISDFDLEDEVDTVKISQQDSLGKIPQKNAQVKISQQNGNAANNSVDTNSAKAGLEKDRLLSPIIEAEAESTARENSVRFYLSSEPQMESEALKHEDSQEICKMDEITADQMSCHDNNVGVKKEPEQGCKGKTSEKEFDKKLTSRKHEKSGCYIFDSFEFGKKKNSSDNGEAGDVNVKNPMNNEVSDTDVLDSLTIEEDQLNDKKSSTDNTVERHHEEIIHTDSHISRCSQDTMDFSCDTLCDESQNLMSLDIEYSNLGQTDQQTDLTPDIIDDQAFENTILLKQAFKNSYKEKASSCKNQQISDKERKFNIKHHGTLSQSPDHYMITANASRQAVVPAASPFNEGVNMSPTSSNSQSTAFSDEIGNMATSARMLAEDGGIPSYCSSDNDEYVYGQLYNEPRLMYPNIVDRKLEVIASPIGNKPAYLSSLQRYKKEIIRNTQPKQHVEEEQYGNHVIEEQYRSNGTQENMFNYESRVNSQISDRGSVDSDSSNFDILLQGNPSLDQESVGPNNTEAESSPHNMGSKWDQYVPEQNEDEIDLVKIKIKKPINKDFSVVESTVKVMPQLQKLNRLTQSVPNPVSLYSDMCQSNMHHLNDKAMVSSREDSVQHVLDSEACSERLSITSDSGKVIEEVPASASSIDSQDLLYAVEDVEKSLLDKYNVDFHEGHKVRTKELSDCGSELKLEQSGDMFENSGKVWKDIGQVKDECDVQDNKVSDSQRERGSLTCDDIERSPSRNLKSISNSIANKSPVNRKSSSDDSLNLSLSFEEQPTFVPAKPTINQQQAPSLRGGWKPPVQKLDCNNESSLGKNDARSLRFLKILQKSNTSPAIESDSFESENNGFTDGLTVSYEYMDYESKNIAIDKTEGPQGQRKSDGNNYKNVSRMGFKSPVFVSQRHTDAQELVGKSQQTKRFRPPSMMNTKSPDTLVQPTKRQFESHSTCRGAQNLAPKLNSTELCFPSRDMVEFSKTITRQVVIPDSFSSVHQYKQVLTAAVIENLNSVLFEISTRYHQALSRIDTSTYEKSAQRSNSTSVSVQCKCGSAAKLLSVRKEGSNKGRQFYGCGKNTQQRCKFFQWAEGKVSNFNSGPGNQRKISDGNSLGLYMKDQHVHFYPECWLVRKTKENIIPYFKRPKWARGNREEDTVQKKQLFLKLPRKGPSSLYAKDDIWIISKDLDFHPSRTFVARSTFYGPLSSNEVEIDPLYGYSPSNWSGEVGCHGLLAGNASTELSCLENIKEHLSAQSPPVLPFLLNRKRENRSEGSLNGFNVPRLVSSSPKFGLELVKKDIMDEIVNRYIDEYRLNTDQTEALRRVSYMFCQEKTESVDNVLLLHGVFGAGKSFLLSVMVLFLVEIFKMISNSQVSCTNPVTWKLLISSTTNVAVDRILQGVLNLGFEDFVRVGSVKKIAKPILPFSIHASGTDNQELKDLQEMLRSSDLTPAEKSHVRQSIEKHRQGENKKKLGAVRVVGVTCASCSVPSLNNMQFPVVFLDECSQMTEPSSLLPIARFGCQKLLLVGDPKQLDPTIEGAKPAHDQGLEQTMFDRMIKMGSIPTILRTQYRCHPWISAISNQLFYGGILYNGISETDRQPLLDMLPTICFYDVNRGQECCERGGSFYNEQEAQFVVFLLQVLTMAGIESSSIGVITLYKSQMSRIMDLIATTGDDPRLKGIQVSTVDAFQGGERDVIILSCVRTQACGFIDNDKRTNVALTRAKHHLLIVGNYRNLSSNFIWGKVLEHCKGHKDGLQCADDARQLLELYLQNLDSQKSFIEDKSTVIEDKTQQFKTKGGKNSQSKKRKRKFTSPSSHEMSSHNESQETVTGSSIYSQDSQKYNYESQREIMDVRGDNSVIVVRDEVARQCVDNVHPCDEEEAESLGNALFNPLPDDKILD